MHVYLFGNNPGTRHEWDYDVVHDLPSTRYYVDVHRDNIVRNDVGVVWSHPHHAFVAVARITSGTYPEDRRNPDTCDWFVDWDVDVLLQSEWIPGSDVRGRPAWSYVDRDGVLHRRKPFSENQDGVANAQFRTPIRITGDRWVTIKARLPARLRGQYEPVP